MRNQWLAKKATYRYPVATNFFAPKHASSGSIVMGFDRNKTGFPIKSTEFVICEEAVDYANATDESVVILKWD